MKRGYLPMPRLYVIMERNCRRQNPYPSMVFRPIELYVTPLPVKDSGS